MFGFVSFLKRFGPIKRDPCDDFQEKVNEISDDFNVNALSVDDLMKVTHIIEEIEVFFN